MSKPSPVIKADVKFMGKPPWLCVDVRFRNRAELDALIQALTILRDGGRQDFDHVHLQDISLTVSGSRGTEVTFYRHGKKRDNAARLCLLEAKQFLTSTTSI